MLKPGLTYTLNHPNHRLNCRVRSSFKKVICQVIPISLPGPQVLMVNPIWLASYYLGYMFVIQPLVYSSRVFFMKLYTSRYLFFYVIVVIFLKKKFIHLLSSPIFLMSPWNKTDLFNPIRAIIWSSFFSIFLSLC